MKRACTALVVVLLLTVFVGFFGCDDKGKDRTITITVTNTVTVHHYYCDVDLVNSDGILSYACYNIDNAFMSEGYGSISVGSLESAPFMGNEMDVGFISFDLGNLDLPENATLASLALHLYNTNDTTNSLQIHITLQDAPSDNVAEMIDAICGGTELAQETIQGTEDYLITIDPAAITLHNGVLYLGIFSDAAFNEPNLAVFDKDTAFVSVEYVLEE